ncbi:MAG TPA: SDR family oxidoreductase [Polyangia bacterium]|jgi:NAD(P)-dependent dehydrogenase (short-subunit alcohol dehydrogenase family)
MGRSDGQGKIHRAAEVTLGGIALARAGRRAWRRLRTPSLQGQTVLITDGSRGLGLALARELAREGAAQLVLCARDAGDLDRAAAELRGPELDVLTVPCDVGRDEDVARLVDATLAHCGRVDILVNNAGVISVGPVETQRPQDFAEAMNIMFFGALRPTLAVLPHMKERRRGHIAFITSIGGKVSVPHLLPHACARFAAVGLAEGLRAEVARFGITVTTVTSPVTSINADHAARRIVRAVRGGEAEIILRPRARALAAFHGLFPTRSFLTRLGQRAAERFRQLPPGEDRRTGNRETGRRGG